MVGYGAGFKHPGAGSWRVKTKDRHFTIRSATVGFVNPAVLSIGDNLVPGYFGQGDHCPVGRTVSLETDCSADWAVIPLSEIPGYQIIANTQDSGINESYCGRTNSEVAVFSFNAPTAGTWVFETGAVTDQPNLDTVLELRSYCSFGRPNDIACDDDGGPNTFSRAETNMQLGETVYIVVGGFGGQSGAFSLSATERLEQTD